LKERMRRRRMRRIEMRRRMREPITPFIMIGSGDHLEALSRFCFNPYINFSWDFNCSTNM